MAKYKKTLLCLDKDSLTILKQYGLTGQSMSETVRLAIANYFHFNKPKINPEAFDGVDSDINYTNA